MLFWKESEHAYFVYECVRITEQKCLGQLEKRDQRVLVVCNQHQVGHWRFKKVIVYLKLAFAKVARHTEKDFWLSYWVYHHCVILFQF